MVDSSLHSSDDFTSMEAVEEILFDTFLDFDFDFSEEICTTSCKFFSSSNYVVSDIANVISVFFCVFSWEEESL